MSVNLFDSYHPSLSIVVNGKKFLWDGLLFESYEEAYREAEAYKNHKFEVHLLEQNNKHFVYTRRVVKDAVNAPQ
jgi:hypothetical protein